MEDVERLAAQQFANIEIARYMMLDLWVQCLIDKGEPIEAAKHHRARQLRSLQDAVDVAPDSFIRQALLGQAEENWREIMKSIKGRSS
ncbi:hypothetical protein [Novosphingobium sp.]|jgi:hypothetical protein|uniref:hypothetical protein n=1 Tax=Novosphingobium sp. TaxID=1874826 RepID=UPI001EB1305A|nr:hypothetical protein [Novosphingobium sp.]MBK6801669.1 hypothetical protein [Novosphingobium sp.]MBK9009962.1 hypothetical protein [Novosphingobium sp.]